MHLTTERQRNLQCQARLIPTQNDHLRLDLESAAGRKASLTMTQEEAADLLRQLESRLAWARGLAKIRTRQSETDSPDSSPSGSPPSGKPKR